MRLSEEAIAKRLRKTPGTLRTWRARGEGPAFLKNGREVTYDEADVESFEQSRFRRVDPRERAEQRRARQQQTAT